MERLLKVALSLSIISLKTFSEIIIHNYIIINASYEGICVEFKIKHNTSLIFLLLNCPKY